jgi:hypothetical protein
MRKLLIAAVLMLAAGNNAIADDQAQSPAPPGVQCNDFAKITAEAQKRSALVATALKSKADHKEICTLMTSFVSAESNVVKFLEDNKVGCGVPDQIVAISKTNHEKSIKFRTAVCEEAPHPKPPTLSDAIQAPSVINPVIRCLVPCGNATCAVLLYGCRERVDIPNVRARRN